MPNPTKKTRKQTTKTLQSKIRKLKKDLKKQKEEAHDWHSKLVYLQAELENFKKRADKEREEFTRYANRQLFEKLLPILDDLDSAVESLKNSEGEASQGVEMIRSNLLELLKSEGLEEIECLGEIVDPYKHEVVHTISDDSVEDNTVAEVVQKGYVYNHRVIRPSRVVAVKNTEE
ncbi:MAG: nucleotide exchange factor GrpE [Thermoplasmata archaeon]